MRRIIVAVAVLALLAVTSAGSAQPSDLTVHITRTGSCYHTADCQSLKHSDIPLTLQEAVERGYRPCNRCLPPVLEGLAREKVAASKKLAVVTLVHVIDGDTIKVRFEGGVESVRLIGVDTPEITRGKNQPFGQEARGFVEAMLSNRRVTLELDLGQRDRYGRLLAYVWAQGGSDQAPILLNAQLVRWGYAQLLTIPPNVKHVERLRNAVAAAQAARVNLWSDIQ